MSSWYTQNAPDNDIVVSSRIRLARNLRGIPFPSRMTGKMRDELKKKVKSAIKDSNTPFAYTLKFIDMADVPDNEVVAMTERHIISPEFARSKAGRALVLSDDESISIMIGEEDHIRIQVILAGLQLEKAYDIAEQVDSMLYKSLQFAFDPNLGYLTECPTNLGTGLRASVMLHLPLCEGLGQLGNLAETVAKVGFTVRGLYGEDSKSEASLYQLSNQITLGISEKTAIDNLKIITNQLIEKERQAEKAIERISIEDKVFRALGTLTNCRILESREMVNLISLIKLGMRMGILKKDYKPMQLLVETQPSMLMKKYGILEPEDRDTVRAKHIREFIQSCH
ncbi:MAG: ATP--guanido phosphotransferase [Acutalibacteraceae bacterium]|jgi:protein arginine kinase